MSKLQIITNVATDLDSAAPFGAGFTVTAVNQTAGALVIQTSDDNGVDDAYATAATCGASTSATAMQPVLLKRWIKLSTAGTVFLLS